MAMAVNKREAKKKGDLLGFKWLKREINSETDTQRQKCMARKECA